MSSPFAEIFSLPATLQRMLDFEAALAKAEAVVGVIPKSAPGPIAISCKAGLYDSAAISAAASTAGNLAIPLVKHLTSQVSRVDPDAARYVHWGATSQDAIDTALVLQLRQCFDLVETALASLCVTLAVLADSHRATPVAGRTWMQHAVPISLGLKFAHWLDSLHRHRARFAASRTRILALQFGGAAGSLASLSAQGLQVSRALAAELNLTLPACPWHTERDRVVEAATLFGMLVGTLGKIARDISLMVQTEVAELAEPAAPGRGASSTLPHKRNPISCAAILAAATRVPGLVGTMLSAMVQEHERALGGWQAEWQTLPEIVCLAGDSLQHATTLLGGLEIDPARMSANIEATRGLIFAESVSMLVASRLGKASAHELVEKASAKALKERRHLRDVLLEDPAVRSHFAGGDIAKLFDPLSYFGAADEFIAQIIKTSQE